MIDSRLTAILACPETGQAVHAVDPAIVVLFNAAIASGTLRNRGGSVVREPIDAALAREDGAICYPVRGGIPAMISEEALALPPPV